MINVNMKSGIMNIIFLTINYYATVHNHSTDLTNNSVKMQIFTRLNVKSLHNCI